MIMLPAQLDDMPCCHHRRPSITCSHIFNAACLTLTPD
jgi:hypothetical protein